MSLHRSWVLALLAASMLLGGCVYRVDIQQGNLLTVKDIEQVTVGMSRSQVRYLLGTPMISDPFAPQRWDYVYRMQYGRDRHIDSAHFVVYFEGDKVVRVETLDPPEPPRLTKQQRKAKKKQAEAESLQDGAKEPPPPPSVEQPGPEAPRPGSR